MYETVLHIRSATIVVEEGERGASSADVSCVYRLVDGTGCLASQAFQIPPAATTTHVKQDEGVFFPCSTDTRLSPKIALFVQPTDLPPPLQFRTTLCEDMKTHNRGSCPFGHYCLCAHSKEELRTPEQNSAEELTSYDAIRYFQEKGRPERDFTPVTAIYNACCRSKAASSVKVGGVKMASGTLKIPFESHGVLFSLKVCVLLPRERLKLEANHRINLLSKWKSTTFHAVSEDLTTMHKDVADATMEEKAPISSLAQNVADFFLMLKQHNLESLESHLSEANFCPVHVAASEGTQATPPISFVDAWNNGPIRHSALPSQVVLVGPAGSGKSTLAKWSAANVHKLICQDGTPFREAVMINVLSLFNFMKRHPKSEWFLEILKTLPCNATAAKQLLEEHADRILYIFDGFGELPPTAEKELCYAKFISGLENMKFSMVKNVLVTARTDVDVCPSWRTRWTLQPWSTPAQINQYVSKFPFTSSSARNKAHVVLSLPCVKEGLPLVTDIVCRTVSKVVADDISFVQKEFEPMDALHNAFGGYQQIELIFGSITTQLVERNNITHMTSERKNRVMEELQEAAFHLLTDDDCDVRNLPDTSSPLLEEVICRCTPRLMSRDSELTEFLAAQYVVQRERLDTFEKLPLSGNALFFVGDMLSSRGPNPSATKFRQGCIQRINRTFAQQCTSLKHTAAQISEMSYAERASVSEQCLAPQVIRFLVRATQEGRPTQSSVPNDDGTKHGGMKQFLESLPQSTLRVPFLKTFLQQPAQPWMLLLVEPAARLGAVYALHWLLSNGGTSHKAPVPPPASVVAAANKSYAIILYSQPQIAELICPGFQFLASVVVGELLHDDDQKMKTGFLQVDQLAEQVQLWRKLNKVTSTICNDDIKSLLVHEYQEFRLVVDKSDLYNMWKDDCDVVEYGNGTTLFKRWLQFKISLPSRVGLDAAREAFLSEIVDGRRCVWPTLPTDDNSETIADALRDAGVLERNENYALFAYCASMYNLPASTTMNLYVLWKTQHHPHHTVPSIQKFMRQRLKKYPSLRATHEDAFVETCLKTCRSDLAKNDQITNALALLGDT